MHTYLLAMVRSNLRGAVAQYKRVLMLSGTMLVQNSLFFAIWYIFFGTVKDVRGWGLPELALFQGDLNIGVGAAFLLADGCRRIAGKVISGELDTYLTRPRHPLPQLMFMQTNYTSFGDIAFGLGLLMLAHLSPAGWGFALLTALLVAVLFIAVTLMLQTLAFYVTGGDRLADQLFDMFLCLSCIPQHTQGVVMKLLLFTAVPAGFIAVLPVGLVRQESPLLVLWLAAAALGYLALAIMAFNFGLRRYVSATGWKV